MTERELKRALRIIGALAGAGPASLRPAGPGTVLIEVADGRRLRCPAGLVDAMVTRGWLARHGAEADGGVAVAATEDGASWRRRMRAGGDYAGQHRQMGSGTVAGHGQVEVNQAESPLARLARPRGRGQPAWLQRSHLLAGERLRSDFEFARLSPRVTASWDPARTVRDGGRNVGDPTDRALDARARFNRALEAVGPELAGILVDVCCFLKGLEQVETERDWPRRSAKVVLKAALCALDRHYNRPLPSGRAGTRHWGAADYRPAL